MDELKNLVNEFSHFARLPSAHLTRNDLNGIVQEALFLFKEGHNDIHFQFRNEEIRRSNWTGADQTRYYQFIGQRGRPL